MGLFSWLQIRRYNYVESDIIAFSGEEAEAFLEVIRKKIWEGFIPDNLYSFKMNKVVYLKCQKCGRKKIKKIR
jgi:hypothetical protein